MCCFEDCGVRGTALECAVGVLLICDGCAGWVGMALRLLLICDGCAGCVGMALLLLLICDGCARWLTVG